jgi:hypothetical protein
MDDSLKLLEKLFKDSEIIYDTLLPNLTSVSSLVS